jgi:signal peptidase II
MQATTGTPLSASAASGARRSAVAVRIWAAVALLVFGVDQASKWWAEQSLVPGVSRPLAGSWLQLQLTRNAGAAFSLGTSYTIVLSLVALGVIGMCLRMSRRLGSVGWATALGLLLGGALGNVTDRLFRAPGPFRGHVVDFLQLPHWPVFNVADSAICTAAALFVYLTVRGRRLDGSLERLSAASGTGTGAARSPATGPAGDTVSESPLEP